MKKFLVVAIAAAIPSLILAHGDVTPQAMDTSALPDVGEDWHFENPYRGSDTFDLAIKMGASGYNQNCARCHGLGGVSGGIAPDLRMLEANESGDEWFAERFRYGYTQNGITKMPGFDQILDQKAAWAIRSYLETRPADGALEPFDAELRKIHEQLVAWSEAGDAAAVHADELDAIRGQLSEIAGQVKTASGAKTADSVVSQALAALDGSENSLKNAAEIMTVGMSAAK